ncbi:MAG: hypothetical protein P8R46_13225, partial [Planctomycetota bacterium]|nr:hypothetical protein [Planctomycetota bacterium]
MIRSPLPAAIATALAFSSPAGAQQAQSITAPKTMSGSLGPISVSPSLVRVVPPMNAAAVMSGLVIIDGEEGYEFLEPPSELIGRGEVVGAGPAGKKAGEPVDPKRVQKFQQAILDRTPSKILAEWSKTAPLASNEDSELQDPPMPEEPAPKLDKPKAPKLQALARLVAPSELVAPVGSVADLAALAKAKQEAEEDHDAEDYAEALAAYQAAEVSDAELQSAYDAD